jgi:hypothetical protein
MKGMQYRLLAAALVLGSFWGLEAKILKVPGPNKLYALAPYHDAQEIEIPDEDNEPIFFILIHGTFSSESDSSDPKNIYFGETEFTETVPKDFFGEGKNPEKDPIRFAYRWSGNWSDDAREKGGKKLAETIRELYAQFPDAWVICAGHSHGGNVMNVASRHLDEKNTMDYVIQLATPVLTYNSKKEMFDPSSKYYPNNKAIDTLMIFYSDQDFVQPGGAGNSAYKRRYAPIPGIDLYNVRMRKIRGMDDLHVHMHDEVVGDKILQLCNKIKNTYKNDKNLICDITPAARRQKMFDELTAGQKAELMKLISMDELLERPLVCIKPYKGKKSGLIASARSYFQGKPTDSFWPDWTNKYPDEKAESDEDAAIFKKLFGFSMDKQLSDLERAKMTAGEYAKEAKRRLF